MPDLSTCEPSPALQAAQAAQVFAENSAEALRTSEIQYRRLFEAARDGILILDSDQGKITDANPFMTELLGYTHNDLLGRQLWEIGLLQDKEAGQEAFRCLKQDGYIRYEDLPLENRRGERRQVEFVSNLYRQNGHSVIQCNIRDITARKRVEAELAAAAAENERQATVLLQHERQAAVLEERTRLAQEIHDTLAQGFTGIAAQLDAAEAALAKLPEPIPASSPAIYQLQITKVKDRIGKARDLARESLAEARRSVTVLRAPPPEAAPLSEALARFLAQRVLDTPVQTRYVLEGVPQSLPVGVEHCLLRVGQEAISNAVEHAQAQEIGVELSFSGDRVHLRVHDDGQGFDLPFVGTGRFGIIGMRERAEKVQGLFSLESCLGGGTIVNLTVLFPQKVPRDL